MPLLSTKAVASVYGFGFMGQSGKYWMGYVASPDRTMPGYGISSDGENNIYLVGLSNLASSSSYASQIIKFSANGNLLWQRQIATAGQEVSLKSIAVSRFGSGYVVAAGSTNTTGDWYIVKYDLSGTLQNQITLNNTAGANDAAASVSCDTSGNFYVAGTPGFLFAKYNSTGGVLWQKTYTASGNTFSASAINYDSARIYSGGITNGNAGFILATDNDGNELVNRTIGSSIYSGASIRAIEASASVYIAGTNVEFGSANPGMMVGKFDNNSGALLWQRRFGNPTSNFSGEGLSVAASSVYAIGANYLVKFDLNGNLLWQRSFSHSSGITLRGVKATNTGVCVTGSIGLTSPTRDGLFVCCVPEDGSLTGTYTVGSESITYAASSQATSSPISVFSASGFVSFISGTPGTASYTETTPTNPSFVTLM